MKRLFLVFCLVALASAVLAQSGIAPFPTVWSFEGIASWSLPKVKLAYSLPAVSDARTGDLVFLANEPSPVLYRNSGTAWELVGATGSETAGSGDFFRFMNVATVPYSIPVIGRAGSWTASPFARVGTSGASLSDSPLYFSPVTGEIGAVIASAARYPTTYLASGITFWPNYAENFNAMFDGDYSTYATLWYDPAGGASGYPSILPIFSLNGFNYAEVGSITAFAVMFNNDQSIIPASITVRFNDGYDTLTYQTNGATTGIGRWFVSATFTPSLYGEYIRFQPNSTVATSPWGTRWRRVEIAEFRFLDTLATSTGSVFGIDSYPQVVPLLSPDPSSATFDALTVRGQTATPTGRVQGTLWLDINLNPPRLKVWSGTAWTSL